ncbi:MAG: GAF domain-containing protein [Gammaproteobacteria bacterium]|nr:GAF domain-containing protein [Gammaproteobacteria bacterium]
MNTDYALLSKQLESLIEHETDEVALLSNASAFINQALLDVNWVGFYLAKQQQLVLGPFQGNVACTRIPLNQGVCGTAAATLKTLRVDDVHQFAGHIACDVRSQSEIVIPLLVNNNLYGVLDIDSERPGRFSQTDQTGLEQLARVIEQNLSEKQ